MPLPAVEEMLGLFDYKEFDDLLAAIGYGGITPHQLAAKLTEEEEEQEIAATAAPAGKISTAGIEVLGVGDLLTRIAACCHPLPGDDIIGFITRSNGVSIHRKDCPNMVNLKERERLIKVNWGKVSEVFPVEIQIKAWNRVGVLKDVSTLLAEGKINISNISLSDQGDQVTMQLTLEVSSMLQLKGILAKISSLRGIIGADRLRSRSRAGLKQ